MGGGVADCTAEGTRQVVPNCPGQNGRARYGMFPRGTHEEVWIAEVRNTAMEEAPPPSRCPRKKPRTFWQTGKTTWWQTTAQEEGNGE